MADFCQQCSIALFGEDLRDLAGIVTAEDLANGGCWVICEGCGATTVDTEGRCLSEDCLEKGHKNAPVTSAPQSP